MNVFKRNGCTLGRLYRRYREALRSRPVWNASYRITLGAVGCLVVVAGLLMIPYPGPGWLVVFAGLAILATEFAWAHRINTRAKRAYRTWIGWLGRQHPAVRIVLALVTALTVLGTLWLVETFSTVGGWFGLHWNWLKSPLW